MILNLYLWSLYHYGFYHITVDRSTSDISPPIPPGRKLSPWGSLESLTRVHDSCFHIVPRCPHVRHGIQSTPTQTSWTGSFNVNSTGSSDPSWFLVKERFVSFLPSRRVIFSIVRTYKFSPSATLAPATRFLCTPPFTSTRHQPPLVRFDSYTLKLEPRRKVFARHPSCLRRKVFTYVL